MHVYALHVGRGSWTMFGCILSIEQSVEIRILSFFLSSLFPFVKLVFFFFFCIVIISFCVTAKQINFIKPNNTSIPFPFRFPSTFRFWTKGHPSFGQAKLWWHSTRCVVTSLTKILMRFLWESGLRRLLSREVLSMFMSFPPLFFKKKIWQQTLILQKSTSTVYTSYCEKRNFRRRKVSYFFVQNVSYGI